MLRKILVVLAFVAVQVQADIYIHNPRGSNNRNCRQDNNKQRREDNRLFDSENNDNGGYNCPKAWPWPCYMFQDDSVKLEACQRINTFKDIFNAADPLTQEEKRAQIDGEGNLVSPPVDLGDGVIVSPTNTPQMYYYSGSELNLQWTMQHGVGPNEELHMQTVIQYACEDTLADNGGVVVNDPDNICKSPFFPDPNIETVASLRDGTPIAVEDNNDDSILNVEGNRRISDSNTDLSDQMDMRYGRHETLNYYNECRRRERNKGLFTADQNVNNNAGARATRQNPGGNDRYGLECPEESQYWPYWHWSPWKDIAVLVEDTSRCELYKSESQNVKSRGRCACPAGECLDDSSQPNNRAACENSGYTWCTDQAHDIDPPECVVADFRRQNHLGDAIQYNWTLPKVDKDTKCVLRMRYNISTYDANLDGVEVSVGGTAAQNGANSPIKDNDNNEAATYIEVEDILDDRASLGYAVNTNQFGRTFQDRSYVFTIKPAPKNGPCEGRKIHNLNVRGKRGNIVQAYPAVEYDFVPNTLSVADDECIHIQWTGSDYNPDRDGNNGEGGPVRPNRADLNGGRTADRHNMAEMMNAGVNYAKTSVKQMNMLGVSEEQIERLLFLDQDWRNPDVCLSFEELEQRFNDRNDREETHLNCMKLSGARTPYFDLGPVRTGRHGMHRYMSTRNNNFTNRGQKGTLNIYKARLGAGAIVGITIATLIALAGMVVFYRRRKQAQSQQPYSNHVQDSNATPPTGGSTGGITALFAGVGSLTTRWIGGTSGSSDGTVVATYPHVAQEPGELNFQKGDQIRVISRDPSGWWEGEVNGVKGIFPANYVR